MDSIIEVLFVFTAILLKMELTPLFWENLKGKSQQSK